MPVSAAVRKAHGVVSLEDLTEDLKETIRFYQQQLEQRTKDPEQIRYERHLAMDILFRDIVKYYPNSKLAKQWKQQSSSRM
jgi:hypothetical protein